MLSEFEAVIRNLDRQIEAKQERLAEQRAALADIQSGLDRLQRSLAADPVATAQTCRPAKGTNLPAEVPGRVLDATVPQQSANGHAEEMPAATVTAASDEAPAGPICQAPGCGLPLPASTGPGPPRRYCDGECRRVAREARVAARAAGVEVAAPEVPFAAAGGASGT